MSTIWFIIHSNGWQIQFRSHRPATNSFSFITDQHAPTCQQNDETNETIAVSTHMLHIFVHVHLTSTGHQKPLARHSCRSIHLPAQRIAYIHIRLWHKSLIICGIERLDVLRLFVGCSEWCSTLKWTTASTMRPEVLGALQRSQS